MRRWGIGYGVPVYGLGGMLSGYFVRSDAETGRVLDAFDVSGAGKFGGVLYTQELARRGRLSHRLSAGIDDRHFDNDVVFAVAVYDGSVTATPTAGPQAAVELGEGDAGLLGEAGAVRLEGGAPAFATEDPYNFSPDVEVGEDGTIEGDLPSPDDEDSMSCRM